MRSRIFLLALILISCLNFSCYNKGCGSGRYKANFIFDTSDYGKITKYDSYDDFMLSEDGNLIAFDNYFNNPTIYRLNDICHTSDIRDVVFYNNHLISKNYWSPNLDQYPSEEDYFILAVTPTKAFKLDMNFNPILEFGNNGIAEESLRRASKADMDDEGNMYIIDEGDNSLKKFDINGAFLQKWTYIGVPKDVDLFGENVYILDGFTDAVKKFSLDGDYREAIVYTPYFSNIISFSMTDNDELWIIDNNGQRISEVVIDGGHLQIGETKTDYCLEDNLFDLKKLVCIDVRFLSFYVVDAEASYILDFIEDPVD